MDTKVIYIVANSDNTSALVSDQIRELNTEILSGKGADVIVLDGLSFESLENERVHNILCSNAAELLVNNIYATMGYTSDMSDIQLYESCTSNLKGLYTPVNHSFIPNGIVGINKSAKDVDLAKDFVMSLYTDEVQKNHLNDGFPMNIQTLKEWIEEEPPANHVFSLLIGDKQGVMHKVETSLLTAKEKKKIYSMMLTLTKPVYDDAVTQDIIVEGGVAYLRDQKTLDEAVDDIVNKINLYLNEQK